MTPQLEALARRAIACKGWRWMPGTLPLSWDGEDWTAEERLTDHQPEGMRVSDKSVPDLTDPATLGCLLALAREAWRDPKGSVYYLAPVETEPGWFAEFGAHDELYASEAEALVAALEAAP